MAISGGGVPQIQNDPIYSLPHLYISGLNVSVASTTVLAVSAGQARDMNDNIDMPVGFPDLQGNTNAAPIYINTAVIGANGLDQGTLLAAANYLVWLIGDSRGYKPVAGLLSLASNYAPLLPFGYDSMRLIALTSTSGSALQTPLQASTQKTSYILPATSVLSGGNATSFTAIDMTAPIPNTPAQGIALLTVNFTPALAGDTVQFRYTGSAATTGLTTITGIASGVPQQNVVQVPYAVVTSNASIDYKVTSSSDAVTVLVNGWTIT